MRGHTVRWGAALVALLLAGGSVAAQARAASSGAGAGGGVPPTGVVAGAVVGEGGQALPAAAVVLQREKDGKAVGTAIVGADGRFRIAEVPAGRYLVVATYLGYQNGRATVVVGEAGGPADAGTIRLVTAPIAMEALHVEAKRSPVIMAPDRSIYSTKDMPVAASGTATDVLRNVPELDVDMNGQVSLRGSSNVTVQVNGRPTPVTGDQLAQFLQQLPANRIERIEVIPNPSAKYAAEGTAGIVNIVLKQGADLGLSGNVALNAGSRVNGGSGRLAYQKGRLTFFGNGSFNYATRATGSLDLRQNLLTEPVTSLTQTGAGDGNNRVGMLDVSSELALSKRSTLWLGGTAFNFHQSTSAVTDYLLADATDPALQRYDRAGLDHMVGTATDFSLGYRRIVQPQQDELSIELRDARWIMGRDARSTQDIFSAAGTSRGDMALNHFHHFIDELSLQADWTHPLSQATKLEAGARISTRPVDFDNTLSLFASPAAAAPEQVQDGTWRHRAGVNALYGTLTRKLGRLTAQGGLRGEASTSSFRVPATGERFDYSYRDLFPSASLAFDLHGGRELRLAYSRRIDRPYPMMMNPYVPSTDPLNRQIGDPYIQPKYTQSLTMDLSWTMKQGSLRLSPYYRSTTDNWDQIKEADSTGVAWLTWKNLARIQAYGTTVTGSLRQWGPVSGFLSLGGYREVRDAGNISTSFSGTSLRFSANGNANLALRPGLDGQLQLNYQPPRDIPQGHLSAMVMSSVGLKQKLNKTTLTAAVMDPFGLWHYDFVTRDATHVQTSHNTMSMRRASVSLSYAFGKPPQQKAKRDPATDPQAAGAPSGPIH